MENKKHRPQKNNNFYEAWRKIRWDPEINDATYRLLCELADCQGQDSDTYISNAALASRLNRSRRTIKYQIKTLKDKEIIEIHFSRGHTRRYISLGRATASALPNPSRAISGTQVGQFDDTSRATAVAPYRAHRTIPIGPVEFSKKIPTGTDQKEENLKHEEWLEMMKKKTKI